MFHVRLNRRINNFYTVMLDDPQDNAEYVFIIPVHHYDFKLYNSTLRVQPVGI